MSLFPMKLRDFLVGAGVSGLGLAFGLEFKPAAAAGKDAAGAGVTTAWVRIAPDDRITIMAAPAEMGQGSTTSMAIIVAEELDADWNKVAVEFSPSNDKLYANPMWWMYGVMESASGWRASAACAPGCRRRSF